MKNLILCFILLSHSLLAFAEVSKVEIPSGVVTKLKGTVYFEGKLVNEGDIINKMGKIETKDKSFLQIKIEKWKNTISIGPNSTMQLNFSDEKKYTLDEGACRWKSFGKSESKGKIFTKNSSMGVRGTDFLLKSNSLLNETEIIMFDGVVLMENSADKSNTAEIKKGQWGGIGGRFGNKISSIIDLPKEIIESNEASLE
jgi:hypothetical protein